MQQGRYSLQQLFWPVVEFAGVLTIRHSQPLAYTASAAGRPHRTASCSKESDSWRNPRLLVPGSSPELPPDLAVCWPRSCSGATRTWRPRRVTVQRWPIYPAFLTGSRRQVKMESRKSGKRPLFSWHNYVVETKFLPRRGAAFADRVYPRNVLLYSSFFSSGGSWVYGWSSVERRRGFAVAGDRPADQPAGATGGVF